MKHRSALIVAALLLIVGSIAVGLIFADRLAERESVWPASLVLSAIMCGVLLLATAVWKQ